MRSSSFVLSAALALTPAVALAQTFDLSIPNIMRGPELYGREPQNPRFTPDGKWIYFQWLAPGSKWNARMENYRVRTAPGATPERISRAQLDSVAPLLAAGAPSPDRLRRVVSVDGDLYLIEAKTNLVRRLTQTPIDESSPVFSTDGKRIFFVRDGSNIMSMDVDTPRIQQLTDIRPGPAPATPPRADAQRSSLERQQLGLFGVIRDNASVDSANKAEREAREAQRLTALYLMPNERVGGMSVAPSGSWAVVTTFTGPATARQTIVPNFVTASGYTEDIVVRTKVGDAQTTGRVALLNLQTGKATWLHPIPGDTGIRSAASIRALGWNDAGTHAVLFSEQANFKARYIHALNAETGSLTSVDVLRDSAWVGGPCFGCGGFFPGANRVWYVSEGDGYAHLYSVNIDGSDKRQLTRGKWEVQDVRLSTDGKHFEMHTSEVSPFERHFYRMPIAGGATEKLTVGVGGHTALLSPDGTQMLDVYSRANRPPELFVGSSKPGSAMSQLTTSPTADWLSYQWRTPEIVNIPASDGMNVPARIYKPTDFGTTGNGAAVIFVHGAGYLHNVHNYWSTYSREYMFHHFLASKGYVVLDIDYRASAGYGRDWRTAIYRWMGGRDLQDHVDGSRYLQKTFGIDPNRIGIYGGSYGGFMTLMALFTAPKEFGAGAALRSVTDWAHYNHGYTARILNQPQDDTLAHRRSSPIFFAEGLEDPLLMAHGMVDTNVHYQDIVRLTQRLIELGKTGWELASYPVEDHGFVRPDSWADEYRRIFELFEAKLPVRRSAGGREP